MTRLAGEWWGSGSWWQFVITLVVGVALGCLGAWATLRAGNPKRKINWWIESNTSLLNLREQPTNGQALTVHLGSHPLQNPRVVELVIANVGTRDVTAAMFHGSSNMRFDFGAVAVAGIVKVRSEPAGLGASDLDIAPVTVVGTQSTSGNWLDLRPCLLKRGQTVLVTMLIDGDEDEVKCTNASLVDVEVVSVPPVQRARAIADAMRGTTLYLGPLRLELGGPTAPRFWI